MERRQINTGMTQRGHEVFKVTNQGVAVERSLILEKLLLTFSVTKLDISERILPVSG